MANKVTLRVTSRKGDDEYSLLPAEMKEYLEQVEQQEQKWIFLNGEFRHSQNITVDELEEAANEDYELVAMNAQAGGEKPVQVNTEFGKTEGDVWASVEEHEFNVEINIVLPEGKALYDLLRNRETLANALKVKLDEYAHKQIEDFMKVIDG